MRTDLFSPQSKKLLALAELENERKSLLSEGYLFIGQCNLLGVISYAFRHPANKNRMLLRLRDTTIEIMKNRELVKTIKL